MKKLLIMIGVLFALIITGCSKSSVELTGAEPPEVQIKIGNEEYPTKLGTYCWGNKCVDTAGPVELLEGTEPIKVKPNEKITIIMDYEPKPNEVHLSQISESDETDVNVNKEVFSAPTEKGVYYYAYGVWWTDEKEENVSHGDAFYAFVIEVE